MKSRDVTPRRDANGEEPGSFDAQVLGRPHGLRAGVGHNRHDFTAISEYAQVGVRAGLQE